MSNRGQSSLGLQLSKPPSLYFLRAWLVNMISLLKVRVREKVPASCILTSAEYLAMTQQRYMKDRAGRFYLGVIAKNVLLSKHPNIEIRDRCLLGLLKLPGIIHAQSRIGHTLALR